MRALHGLCVFSFRHVFLPYSCVKSPSEKYSLHVSHPWIRPNKGTALRGFGPFFSLEANLGFAGVFWEIANLFHFSVGTYDVDLLGP